MPPLPLTLPLRPQLNAELREVSGLIDRIETSPGLTASHLAAVRPMPIRRLSPPGSAGASAAPAAAREASSAPEDAKAIAARARRRAKAASAEQSPDGAADGRVGELRSIATSRGVEVETLLRVIEEAEDDADELRREALALAGGAEGGEVVRLREEVSLLETQVELLSEKMYGSPAKSAAKERDRFFVELEREREMRCRAEADAARLAEALDAASARVAQLEKREHQDVETARELERTKLALRTARANAAMQLVEQPPPVRRIGAPGYATPSGRHAIAMPRGQFGGGGSLRGTPAKGLSPSDPRLSSRVPSASRYGRPSPHTPPRPMAGSAGRRR